MVHGGHLPILQAETNSILVAQKIATLKDILFSLLNKYAF